MLLVVDHGVDALDGSDSGAVWSAFDSLVALVGRDCMGAHELRRVGIVEGNVLGPHIVAVLSIIFERDRFNRGNLRWTGLLFV